MIYELIYKQMTTNFIDSKIRNTKIDIYIAYNILLFDFIKKKFIILY